MESAFVRFLSALTILLFGSIVSASDLYTAQDRLVCKNTEVRAFTTCTSDSTVAMDAECTEQHFIFADRDGKVLARVPGSARLSQRLRDDGKDLGTWLDALARDWACLKGRNSPFVVITYWDGGNCSRCDWDEIFDLKGNRLATSEVPPWVNDKEEERIGKAFFKKYDALGLPTPWPDSSFQQFRVFEHPYMPK